MTKRTKLSNPDELLHRQVHPNFVDDGRPTSAAFRPTRKDEGCLSVDRDTIATAEKSFRLHTEEKQLDSAGTWSVSVGECNMLDLCGYEAELEDNPAHCCVDFSESTRSQVRKCSKKLKKKALARGKTYPKAT